MALVRKTNLLLRRTAAVLTLIGAGVPALAGSWDSFFSLPAWPGTARAGDTSQAVPGFLFGMTLPDREQAAAYGAQDAPRLRAGYGTGSFQGFLSMTALPDTGSGRTDSGIGIGVVFAPNGAMELQGELQHRAPDSSGDAGWQDRLQLSASFRF